MYWENRGTPDYSKMNGFVIGIENNIFFEKRKTSSFHGNYEPIHLAVVRNSPILLFSSTLVPFSQIQNHFFPTGGH